MGVVDSDVVDLIGPIYDAVLDPALWHDALDGIRRYYDFHNSILGIARYGHQAGSLLVPVNVPEDYQLAMQRPEYSDEVIRLWGGRERAARYPIEEPIVLLDVVDQETLRTNAYQRAFGEPQGLVDHIAIVLARDRRQIANVAFGRHADFGPVTENVVAGMRILAPHLRRAALISGILDEERKARTMFEAVLAVVRSGVVLVDRNSRIIYANAAAEAAIDAGDPLHKVSGKLEVRGEVVPGHLLLAIERAAEGDIPLGRRGIAIPGTRADGTPFVIHVLPLGDRRVRSGVPGEAIAAVFVVDRDDDPHFGVDAAALIYSLTPTEARVFELIVGGHSSAEIRAAIPISDNTLKTHTKRLFEKTGQHRRSDLVRLAARLQPAGH